MSRTHGSDFGSFPSVYSVNMFYNGEHSFTSDTFHSRDQAEDFLDYCRRMNTNDIQFQIYKYSPRGDPEYNDHSTHVTDQDHNEEYDLTGMTIEAYKRGYLLRPMHNDSRQGQKYFMGGFWNRSLDAWVFRSTDKETLLEHGAQFVNDYVLSEDEAEAEIASNKCASLTDLKVKGMLMEKYGKGYILYPKATHPHYSAPYFNHGWWNSSAKGWFFKAEHYDDLIAAGVKYHTRNSRNH